MRDDFAEAVEMYASKSGVPEEKVLEAISKALFSAYKKITKSENLEIILDRDKKSLKIYSKKIVSDIVTNKVTEISLTDAQKIKNDAKRADAIKITSVLGRHPVRIATGEGFSSFTADM